MAGKTTNGWVAKLAIMVMASLIVTISIGTWAYTHKVEEKVHSVAARQEKILTGYTMSVENINEKLADIKRDIREIKDCCVGR